MKKFLILLLIIILAPMIGGMYGIIHDQLTYSISEEYYTKFKFIQFGLVDPGIENVVQRPRLYASIVGFLATWWMGLPIGIILGLVGLMHADYKLMFNYTMQAILITLIVAFTIGLVGLVYGELILAKTGVNWWLPENLVDVRNFISVGSMHNFGYVGGITGLIVGIIYIVRQTRRLKQI